MLLGRDTSLNSWLHFVSQTVAMLAQMFLVPFALTQDFRVISIIVHVAERMNFAMDGVQGTAICQYSVKIFSIDVVFSCQSKTINWSVLQLP